jgi:Asp-tRNA(Asn)/Glu-tRNA(Gln) amidotransferase A subunit family amidase
LLRWPDRAASGGPGHALDASSPPAHATSSTASHGATATAVGVTPLTNSYAMGVFTSLFNVTGQPAISLPIHHDDATGLPVGVQIVAAPWREDLLLRVARFLEVAHPWTGRRPALVDSPR